MDNEEKKAANTGAFREIHEFCCRVRGRGVMESYSNGDRFVPGSTLPSVYEGQVMRNEDGQLGLFTWSNEGVCQVLILSPLVPTPWRYAHRGGEMKSAALAADSSAVCYVTSKGHVYTFDTTEKELYFPLTGMDGVVHVRDRIFLVYKMAPPIACLVDSQEGRPLSEMLEFPGGEFTMPPTVSQEGGPSGFFFTDVNSFFSRDVTDLTQYGEGGFRKLVTTGGPYPGFACHVSGSTVRILCHVTREGCRCQCPTSWYTLTVVKVGEKTRRNVIMSPRDDKNSGSRLNDDIPESGVFLSPHNYRTHDFSLLLVDVEEQGKRVEGRITRAPGRAEAMAIALDYRLRKPSVPNVWFPARFRDAGTTSTKRK